MLKLLDESFLQRTYWIHTDSSKPPQVEMFPLPIPMTENGFCIKNLAVKLVTRGSCGG